MLHTWLASRIPEFCFLFAGDLHLQFGRDNSLEVRMGELVWSVTNAIERLPGFGNSSILVEHNLFELVHQWLLHMQCHCSCFTYTLRVRRRAFGNSPPNCLPELFV